MNTAPSAVVLYGTCLVVAAGCVAGAVLFMRRRTPLSRVSVSVRLSGVAFLLLAAVIYGVLAFHAAFGWHIINDDGSVSPHMWMLTGAQAAAAWVFLFAGAAAASRHFPPTEKPDASEPDL